MDSDAFDQFQEAYRLFLRWLQTLDDAGLRGLCFPASAGRDLRAADAAAIARLAEFPRALFRLRFMHRLEGGFRANLAGEIDLTPLAKADAGRVLALTILYSAWSISRDSTYRGRLLFGLTPREMHALRTTALSDLPAIALTCLKLECAFSDAEWLWRRLLTETRPEVRRQLVLVALQPPPDIASMIDRVAEPVDAQ
jgi:hypothetical protein